MALLFHCLLVCLLSAPALAAPDDPKELSERARKAEKAGRWEEAYALMVQAAVLSPRNASYWLQAQRLRTRLQSPAAVPATIESLARPQPEPPGLTLEERRLLAEARTARPPIELRPSAGTRSFDTEGSGRTLWEQVASGYGLDVVFDADYRDTDPLRFRIEEADHRQAVWALEAATGCFIVPVSERLMLIANDNAQKRRDLEPAVSVMVPLPTPVSMEEVNSITQAVRQLVDLQKLFVDSQNRVVVMNGPLSKIRPAQRVFEQFLHHRPEIRMDLELIEVSRNRLLSYGLMTQTQFPFFYLGGVLNSQASVPQGMNFTRFIGLGAGRTFLALGVLDAEMFVRLTRGQGRSLFRANLRSVDGQKAELLVGDRFPLATSFFTTIDDPSPTDSIVPPTITYEELGLSVRMTPHLLGEGQVSFELETEFKLLTGQAVNGLPVISNRSFQAHISLPQDRWGIVSGLLNVDEARTITGLAGLSQIPGLGVLFRQNRREERETEILLVIRPTILAPRPDDSMAPALRVGSESRPLSPL